MKNQNDPTAKFYDIVSKAMKPDEITNQEIDLVTTLLGSDTSKLILDVGCGTGRHSIPLLQLGYKVSGVEESEEMIRQLKEKAKDIPSFNDSNFSNESIFDFNTDVRFDLIILFWNTFNESALTDEKARQLVGKLNSLLADDGSILINSDDPNAWATENYTYGYTTEVDGIPTEYSWSLFEHSKETGVSKTKESIVLKPEGRPEEIHETEIHQRWYSFEKYQRLFNNFGYILEKRSIRGNNEMYIVASRE